MNLLWPGFLFLLAILPLTAALYIWVLRRRRRDAVRFSSLLYIRAALPRQSRWKRHLPFALFLLALLSLVIAFTRPVTTTLVPAGRATIMLTMDVSRSMLQNDIRPNRLIAAAEAALSYIQRSRDHTQIGIVVFAGYAQLVQPPTTDQQALQAVVESLTTGRGTAIGSGILAALDTIAELNENVTPVTGGPETQFQPVPEGS
jgi:Ca-activated chloride channel homolog